VLASETSKVELVRSYESRSSIGSICRRRLAIRIWLLRCVFNSRQLLWFDLEDVLTVKLVLILTEADALRVEVYEDPHFGEQLSDVLLLQEQLLLVVGHLGVLILDLLLNQHLPLEELLLLNEEDLLLSDHLLLRLLPRFELLVVVLLLRPLQFASLHVLEQLAGSLGVLLQLFVVDVRLEDDGVLFHLHQS